MRTKAGQKPKPAYILLGCDESRELLIKLALETSHSLSECADLHRSAFPSMDVSRKDVMEMIVRLRYVGPPDGDTSVGTNGYMNAYQMVVDSQHNVA